jgi:hypothetical protein
MNVSSKTSISHLRSAYLDRARHSHQLTRAKGPEFTDRPTLPNIGSAHGLVRRRLDRHGEPLSSTRSGASGNARPKGSPPEPSHIFALEHENVPHASGRAVEQPVDRVQFLVAPKDRHWGEHPGLGYRAVAIAALTQEALAGETEQPRESSVAKCR